MLWTKALNPYLQTTHGNLKCSSTHLAGETELISKCAFNRLFSAKANITRMYFLNLVNNEARLALFILSKSLKARWNCRPATADLCWEAQAGRARDVATLEELCEDKCFPEITGKIGKLCKGKPAWGSVTSARAQPAPDIICNIHM